MSGQTTLGLGEGLYLIRVKDGRAQYVSIPEDALEPQLTRRQVWEQFLLPAYVALLQIVRPK